MPTVELDVQTLATVLAVVCAVLTGLLALSWVQNLDVGAFGLWTLSFALCTAAASFVAGQHRFPGLLAIDIANVLRLLAFGDRLAGGTEFRRTQEEAGRWRSRRLYFGLP